MNNPTLPTEVQWRFAKNGSKRSLQLTLNGSMREQPISAAEEKALLRSKAEWEFFVQLYGKAYLTHSVDIPIAYFLPLEAISAPQQEVLNKIANSSEGLYFFYLAQKLPKAEPQAIDRLLKTLLNFNVSDETFISVGRKFPLRPTVQKLPLDSWLDFLDYYINAEEKETFSAFQKKHKGRIAPLRVEVKPTRYQNKIFYRQDAYALDHYELERVAHRFLQLSKRSRKLQKKLEVMPFQKLAQALSFEFPGTLLANDTIELIDSLKHVPPRNQASTVPPGRAYRWDETNLTALLGGPLGRKIEKLKLGPRFAPYLAYSYDRSHVIIEDAPWGNGQIPFIVHMLHKMGPEETIKTMELIRNESDGVTMRGWMQLVRQKGFASGSPAAWQTMLLANK